MLEASGIHRAGAETLERASWCEEPPRHQHRLIHANAERLGSEEEVNAALHLHCWNRPGGLRPCLHTVTATTAPIVAQQRRG